MTAQEIGSEYLTACERRTDNALTNANRRRLVAAFTAWMAETGAGWTDDTLADYRAHLGSVVSERTGRPLSVGTRRQLLREAVALCRWAAGRHMIDVDITGSVPTIRRPAEGHRRDALPEAGARRLVETIKGDTLADERDRVAVLLELVCGLRCVELARLRCGDLLRVEWQDALLIQGKGHEDRDTLQPVPRDLAAMIRGYMDRLPDHGHDAPLLPALDPHTRGQAVTAAGWSRIIKRRLREAGYDSPRLTAHSLRHTSITIGLEHGATLLELQQHARHRDISTTTIYTHEHERLDNAVSGLVWQAVTDADAPTDIGIKAL